MFGGDYLHREMRRDEVRREIACRAMAQPLAWWPAAASAQDLAVDAPSGARLVESERI